MGVADSSGEAPTTAPGSLPESQLQFMRAALQMAERSLAAGGPPVGACLVQGSGAAAELVCAGHNRVVADLDATAHAEIALIREACARLRSLVLDDCTLYVTVEPCAMCIAGCYYAGIREVIYGAPIAAMHAITGSELCVDHAIWMAGAPNSVRLSGGVCEAEALALLERWSPALSGRR